MNDDNIDLDELLDIELDDLADLPEFKFPPPGTHRALASLNKKVINQHPAIEHTFKYIECVELADPDTPEEDKCAEGDESNIAYMLDNEFGQGNFKKAAAIYGAAMGISKVGEIVDNVQDVEVLITTSVRIDKNDKTKKYMNLIELAVI